MAAPIFEQSEIDAILDCEKYLSSDAQKRRTRYRSSDGTRQRKLELQILSDVPWPLEVFFEESIKDSRSEVTFGLLADVDKRGRELVCHYDIQANWHENPPWSDGKTLNPYVPHKHVYSPENLRHGDLTGLRIATAIKMRAQDSFEKKTENLFRIFCDDLKITMDKDPQLNLFQ
jgi:hypothetical protein